VQPDNGTICAYWVSALISTIDVASGTGLEYRNVALQALCMALYLHTGSLVPRSQRRRLCRVSSLLLEDCIKHNGSAPPGTHACKALHHAMMAAVSILNQVTTDAAFAGCAQELARFRSLATSEEGLKVTGAMVSLQMPHSPGRAPVVLFDHDSFMLPCAAAMSAQLVVRGSGLVASTYGMRRCRDAVATLVTRWRAGPWAGRLDTPADCIVLLGRDQSGRAAVHLRQGPLRCRRRSGTCALCTLRQDRLLCPASNAPRSYATCAARAAAA
jgi:hypothetical protein